MRAKKLLSVVLAFVMVLSLLPVSALAANYSDAEGHWAEAAINRWSDYGIVTGDERGFRPNDNMTRAEAAKVLCELFGLTSTAGAASFTDVPANAWYANYIAKANAAGIMGGVGDNQANPNGTLTRETFFVMFARGLGLKEQSATSGVAADGDSWANGYINALTDKGYVKGDGTGVNALANINRASVMSLLDQTITQYVNESGTVTLTADKGIVLVNAKNVTLTGTTNADVVIAKGASGSSVAFSKATVNGAVTVQADNAKVTADKDSKLAATPVVNGAGSTYTAANGTTISGGGGSTPTTTIPADDDGPVQQVVTSASQIKYSTNAATGQKRVIGDLIIGEGLGDGEIELDGYEITGNLIVRGGGASSVKLTNTQIALKVRVEKPASAGAEVPSIKVMDNKTTIGDGVTVAADTKGATLYVDSAASSNGAAFGEVVTAADLFLDGYAALSKVTVSAPTEETVTVDSKNDNASVTNAVVISSGSAEIKETTGSGAFSKVVAANSDGGAAIINTNVATVEAEGDDTVIDVVSGTISTLEVTGGSAAVVGSGTISNLSSLPVAGDLVWANSNALTKAIVAADNVVIAVAEGATITEIDAKTNNANNIVVDSYGMGGTVSTVNTNSNVVVMTPVNAVNVDNTSGTAAVVVDGGATITTLTSNGAGTVVVASGASSGGTVTTLAAASNSGDIAVETSDDENGDEVPLAVTEITVANTSRTTGVTVNGGEVAKITATGNVAVKASANSSGTVAQVTGTASSISVDAAVVETVAPKSGATVIVSGDEGVELDVSAGNVTVAATNGASASNIEVAGTTQNTATINGTAITAAKKSAAPSRIDFSKSGNNIVATVNYADPNGTAVVKLYSDSAAKTPLEGVEPKTVLDNSTSVAFTLGASFTGTVYATITVGTDKESATVGGTLAEFKAVVSEYDFGSGAWGESGSFVYTASKLFTGGVSSVTYEAAGADGTIAKWVGSDTNTLTVSRENATTTKDAFTVTITATDNIGRTAQTLVHIGATVAPDSPAIVATLSGSQNKTLTVKRADDSALVDGKIFVYASSAATDTTDLVATSGSDSGTGTNKELTLTAAPKGNVYVVYQATGMNATARTVSTGYKAIQKKDRADVANTVFNTSGVKQSGTDFPITFDSNYVEGGSGTYAYAVSGPSWLVFDTSNTNQLKVSGTPLTAAAATPVTVTITDSNDNRSIAYEFTVAVSDNISTKLDETNPATFGSSNATLTVKLQSNTWEVGDQVKLYANEKAAAALATITVTAAQKAAVTDTSAIAFDMAALGIKVPSGVYVAYTQSGKLESPRAMTTNYTNLSVSSSNTSEISALASLKYGDTVSTVTYTATGGYGDYTYSIIPALPSGITFTTEKASSSSTAMNVVKIAGTANAVAASGKYTVYASDAAGNTVAADAFTLEVAKATQTNTPAANVATAANASGIAVIGNVTDAMEYNLTAADHNGAWTAITGTTANVTVGTAASADNRNVYIRYKETATTAAGASDKTQTLVVAKYVPAATPTISSFQATTISGVGEKTEAVASIQKGDSSDTILTISASQGSDGTTGSLTYEWFKDGEKITGASSETYTLSAEDKATVGTYNYTVKVTNTAGSLTKTVETEPVIVVVMEKTYGITGTLSAGETGTDLTGFVLSLYAADADGEPTGNAIGTSTGASISFANVPGSAEGAKYVITAPATATSAAVKQAVTVKDQAVTQSITLTAATATVYTVTKPTTSSDTVTSATITAPFKGLDAVTATYTTSVSSSLNGATATLDSPTIEWSLDSAYTGVSINASTGVLTVTSDVAEDAVITIIATSNGASNSATLTVKAANKAILDLIGVHSVAYGATAEDATYICTPTITGLVADQEKTTAANTADTDGKWTVFTGTLTEDNLLYHPNGEKTLGWWLGIGIPASLSGNGTVALAKTLDGSRLDALTTAIASSDLKTSTHTGGSVSEGLQGDVTSGTDGVAYNTYYFDLAQVVGTSATYSTTPTIMFALKVGNAHYLYILTLNVTTKTTYVLEQASNKYIVSDTSSMTVKRNSESVKLTVAGTEEAIGALIGGADAAAKTTALKKIAVATNGWLDSAAFADGTNTKVNAAANGFQTAEIVPVSAARYATKVGAMKGWLYTGKAADVEDDASSVRALFTLNVVDTNSTPKFFVWGEVSDASAAKNPSTMLELKAKSAGGEFTEDVTLKGWGLTSADNALSDSSRHFLNSTGVAGGTQIQIKAASGYAIGSVTLKGQPVTDSDGAYVVTVPETADLTGLVIEVTTTPAT